MTDRGLLDYNDLCECKNTFPGIHCAQAIIEDCGCVPLGIACEQADLFGVSCEKLKTRAEDFSKSKVRVPQCANHSAVLSIICEKIPSNIL